MNLLMPHKINPKITPKDLLMQNGTTATSNGNRLEVKSLHLTEEENGDNQNLKTKVVYPEMKAIIVQVLPLLWLLPTTSPSTSEILINGDLKKE